MKVLRTNRLLGKIRELEVKYWQGS